MLVEGETCLINKGHEARARSQEVLDRAQAACHRALLAINKGKCIHEVTAQVPPTVMLNAKGEYLVLKIFERAEEVTKKPKVPMQTVKVLVPNR